MGSPRLPVVHELLGRLYSDSEWEALCNRCGACCYESRWTDVGWEDTGVACPHLDLETTLCTAYGERFDVEADCIRVTPSVVLSGILPSECSYHDELRRLTDEDEAAFDRRDARRARRRR